MDDIKIELDKLITIGNALVAKRQEIQSQFEPIRIRIGEILKIVRNSGLKRVQDAI